MFMSFNWHNTPTSSQQKCHEGDKRRQFLEFGRLSINMCLSCNVIIAVKAVCVAVLSALTIRLMMFASHSKP